MATLTVPDPMAWQATLRALEECREAMLVRGADLQADGMHRRLSALLDDASECSRLSHDRPDASFWLCREATVEWMANLASVVMLANLTAAQSCSEIGGSEIGRDLDLTPCGHRHRYAR